MASIAINNFVNVNAPIIWGVALAQQQPTHLYPPTVIINLGQASVLASLSLHSIYCLAVTRVHQLSGIGFFFLSD